MKIFVSCSQGLEPVLIQELEKMGFQDVREGFRGVHVEVNDFSDVYRINYCSRIGGRVLLPLTDFVCYDQKALYKGALKIDWASYIAPGKTIAIDSNVNHKHLRNSLFAAQVVKDAICDQIREKRGTRPDVDVKNPDVQLNLFIHQDRAIISLDTSGTPLHKRGYRQETVEAPIQETLAAAILMIADYQGDEILYDPCCGSGTFLIEAALMASRTAPGYLRKSWGFMNLPEFTKEDWLEVKNEEDAKRIPLIHGKIYGSDLGRNQVRITKVNVRAAGFLGLVEVKQGDFKEIEPAPPPTLIVTNPPYGKRLADEEEYLISLYRALGDFLKRKSAKPAKGFIFTGNLELAKEIGLAPKRRYVMSNSGIESRLLSFDLY